MIYHTQEFISPTGYIMIFAEYDLNSKKLQFKIAKKYFYPQDSKHMVAFINTESFIKENSIFKETLEEANKYLFSIGINNSFKKGSF